MKSTISVLIIVVYILCSLRIRTGPWKYFQLNAMHFSADKGIFSKISIDRMIPEKWKLAQERLTANFKPAAYPVFVKPEWGQNAKGISRADNEDQLRAICENVANLPTNYIVQESATESREFEIFTVFSDAERTKCAAISVTETINDAQEFPINSIYNQDTSFHQITHQFSQADLDKLCAYKLELGRFGQSRLSVKANSIQDLVEGSFHIVELNLFTPMPINLLDDKLTWMQRFRYIGEYSQALAEATRTIQKKRKTSAIYTRMCLYGRKQNAISSVLRSFL